MFKKSAWCLAFAFAAAPALVMNLVACGSRGDDSSASEADLASAASSPVHISQIYARGAGADAAYPSTYVELKNRSQKPADLSAMALELAAVDGTFNAARAIELPSVTLAPGQHFLVEVSGQRAANSASRDDGGTGSSLEADLRSDAESLATSGGKIALVAKAHLLTDCGSRTSPCALGDVLDFVGFGTASQATGTALPALSPSTAALRRAEGCQSTGNNAQDFEVGTPAPHNMASRFDACPAPSADGGAEGGAVDAGPPPMVLVNEIEVGPAGTGAPSPYEFIEIACTPKASLANHYFVAMSAPPGKTRVVVSLGTRKCGANGLVYIKNAVPSAGHKSSETQTVVLLSLNVPDAGTPVALSDANAFMIVRSPEPIAEGVDYTAEDGSLLFPAGASVVDGLAFVGGNPATKFVPSLELPQTVEATAHAATRISGDQKALSATAFFGGALSGGADSTTYEVAKSTKNLPKSADLSPGGSNAKPQTTAPSDTTEPTGDETPEEQPAPTTTTTQTLAPKADPSSADSVCSVFAPGHSGASPSGLGLALGAALVLAARRRRSAA